MGIIKFIIIREMDEESTKSEKEIENALESVEEYGQYLEVHGKHFTDELAEMASKRMKNRNGLYHSWSVNDIKNAFERIGLEKPEEYTWGDATYAANMAYADFYGSSLKTEQDCLKYSHDLMSDVDGYDGMILNRYISDLMGKKIKMDWSKYI